MEVAIDRDLDRTSTAYHEAGHAVAIIICGYDFTNIEIHQEGQAWFGTTGSLLLCDGQHQLPDRIDLWHFVVVAMAGDIAKWKKKHDAPPPWNIITAKDDYKNKALPCATAYAATVKEDQWKLSDGIVLTKQADMKWKITIPAGRTCESEPLGVARHLVKYIWQENLGMFNSPPARWLAVETIAEALIQRSQENSDKPAVITRKDPVFSEISSMLSGG